MKTSSFKQYIPALSGNKHILFLGLASMVHVSAFAAEKTAAAEPSVLFNPLFMALSIVVILLAILILTFSGIIRTGLYIQLEKKKAEKGAGDKVLKSLALLLAAGTFSNSLFAQAAAQPVLNEAPKTYLGLNSYVFYLMISLIIVEIVAAIFMYIIAMRMLGVWDIQRKLSEEKASLRVGKASLMEKLNASVAIEKEADIMLDHDYDGIHELDNDLPPWWKYGFYFTIIVAIVYLGYYHVTNTGNLQLAEYEIQLAQGRSDVEAYQKKAANLVDENNVAVLLDAGSLDAGKAMFVKNCAPCHGQGGEGTVGPNLTDEYWLHKGSVRDIFKSIKYGWPEKGMKSWQQDLSSRQIHELSSYIVSLRGSNPPKGKEKQGELYIEEQAGDSLQSQHDSINVVAKHE
jgi:cytochrome c oxidase cbb3-type subunit 3